MTIDTKDDGEENKRVVTRWIELANAHRFDELTEVWADDVIVHQGSDVEDTTGFAAFKLLLDAFFVGIPDLHIHVDDVVGAGDTVMLRTTSTGTHTGPFLGVPATGKTLHYVGIGTYEVRGGKITQEWFNDDMYSLMNAITSA